MAKQLKKKKRSVSAAKPDADEDASLKRSKTASASGKRKVVKKKSSAKKSALPSASGKTPSETSSAKAARSARKKGSQKEPAAPQPEMNSEETGIESIEDAKAIKPKTRGVSLMTRLTIIMTLTTMLVTLAVGFTIATRTRPFLSNEIKKTGTASVKLLAALGKKAIVDSYTGEEGSSGEDGYVELTRKIKEQFENAKIQKELNDLKRSYFPSLPSPFLDVKVTVIDNNYTQQKQVISLMKTGSEKQNLKEFNMNFVQFEYASGNSVSDVKTNWSKERDSEMGTIAISDTEIVRDGVEHTAFQFQMYFDLSFLSDKYKETGPQPKRGVARVMLDTVKVKEAEDAVFFTTFLILAVAILVSIIISLLLSRSIIKPIQMLVKDMSIVSTGNLDHKTVPRSSDEVGYLATTFNQLTQSLKVAHEAEVKKEKMEHELNVGREIQQSLLPKVLPPIPGYDYDAFYKAANEVGGDYYDLILVDKKAMKLGIVVADVSGKGIPGSMLMTVMRTIINIAGVGNPSCANCLAKTNRFLADRIKRGMFITSFYSILDCRNHTMRYSSAGHNPMLVYRARTKEIEKFNPPGIALGFDKGPLFEKTLKEHELKLEKGDRFLMFTDGVVEAMNEKREEFSDERLLDFLTVNANLTSKDFIGKLVSALEKHQGKAPQHDDITIVTFRKL